MFFGQSEHSFVVFQVYSLIGGFCGSPVNFHAKDGSGYKFLGELVLQLDKINPQVISSSRKSLAIAYATVKTYVIDILDFLLFSLIGCFFLLH